MKRRREPRAHERLGGAGVGVDHGTEDVFRVEG